MIGSRPLAVFRNSLARIVHAIEIVAGFFEWDFTLGGGRS
jgi:hypothetical protein